MDFAATREEGLERLGDFVGVSGKYSRDRNFVRAGHGNVSCLSAAIRHRLLTEWEVADAPLRRYAASTVEKFRQEVYWRSYWKGWLSLRPQVWDEYLGELAELEVSGAVKRVQLGEGRVAVMNGFARELRETGYLHNHARMWFAAYWVHVERLPWVLGAKFFQDHLLDFDPAANTLSWRWVAGLQTPGKTYLPRRANLEKYLEGSLLDPEGLELLENPVAFLPERVERAAVTRVELPGDVAVEEGGVLWIHAEDLNVESTVLGEMKPRRVVVTGEWRGKSERQAAWLERALADAAERARAHYGVSVDRADDLGAWARENEVGEVTAMRPEVGPLWDAVKTWEEEGLQMSFVVRAEDRFLRGLATAGFFGFWKKLQGRLKDGEFPF